MSDKEHSDVIAFIEKAHEVCLESGKQYDFECPLCGGEAVVYKAKCNGHHRAACKGCDFGFME